MRQTEEGKLWRAIAERILDTSTTEYVCHQIEGSLYPYSAPITDDYLIRQTMLRRLRSHEFGNGFTIPAHWYTDEWDTWRERRSLGCLWLALEADGVITWPGESES